MDGKTFAKCAKDCKIINKKCTNTDIDLIFADFIERLLGMSSRPTMKQLQEALTRFFGSAMALLSHAV